MSSAGGCETSCPVYSSAECPGQTMVAGSVYPPGHYPHQEHYEMGNLDYMQESSMPSYEANVPVSEVGMENSLPPYCHASLAPGGSPGCPPGMDAASVYGGYPHQQAFMPLDTYHSSYMDHHRMNGQGKHVILGPNGKPKRKRVATLAQRRAANIRERRRMFNLNEAFDELRTRVPTFAYEKRLSRIETLRLAITYISFMADVVDGKDPKDVKLVSLKGAHWIPLKKTADGSEKAPPSPITRNT